MQNGPKGNNNATIWERVRDGVVETGEKIGCQYNTDIEVPRTQPKGAAQKAIWLQSLGERIRNTDSGLKTVSMVLKLHDEKGDYTE